jgi:ribosome-associated toxin RatA of RatAB toxin-antitoxin module
MLSERRIAVSRVLRASPDRAFQIVVDVERFPTFMSNVTSVEVVSATQECRVVAWQLSIDDAPLDWVEEIVYDYADKRASFRALDGVFSRFDGHWKVSAEGAGSRVDLLLDYDLGVPEIEHIIGPLLQARLIENLESMMKCIEEEADSG